MNQPPAEVPVPQGPRPYDRQRYEELTQRLGMALLQVAPAGWRRIDLRILMLAGVTDLRLSVIMPDGSSPAADPPRECAQIAAELRSMMYRPGEGTWFGMRFMMDPPSAYWVSFNADFDPGWEPPAAPEEWARDLALFPRDDAHVPGWLRERLGQGADAHGG
ncbi:hypothetical protein SAMN05443665_102195 [Actinomadura meyerae]|jgi:hypothetical protein|uniref:Uncharacterized protein n=1 Tax=Actinomadura meyerae TaxID=240840 RepID=A0A239LA73_9ACTN|nr:hypothetical protein [Actinomadura meyerae]SNT26872.1 hypothetical protein SAMN05443665_102195 [Actinomadura meyerae]